MPASTWPTTSARRLTGCSAISTTAPICSRSRPSNAWPPRCSACCMQTLADHPHDALLAHPDHQAVQLPASPRTWPCADFLALWRQALAAGDERPALREGEVQISYGELERRANRFAHHLSEQGIAAGMTVALCQERTIDWVTTPERLQHLLRTSAARLLVHAPGDAQAAALGVCPALAFDAARHEGGSERPPAVSILPGQAAYIIYTSGSTSPRAWWSATVPWPTTCKACCNAWTCRTTPAWRWSPPWPPTWDTRCCSGRWRAAVCCTSWITTKASIRTPSRATWTSIRSMS